MRKVFSAFLTVTMLFSIAFVIGCNDDGGGGGKPTPTPTPTPVQSSSIKGTVSSNPPEAGVWVIAETDEVLTLNGGVGIFRKIVVTDANGNFVIPDLPEATYDVWVRGYGLKDSDPVQASPGDELDLEVEVAATPVEAAAVYPANYWYSLVELPSTDEFPGTGPEGNGWGAGLVTRDHLVSSAKLGCELCHQMGTLATRIPGAAAQKFGWMKAGTMNGTAAGIGIDNWAEVLGDWGSRIQAGETPAQPPRPQGIERNIVITQWEWGDTFTYAHDEIATDKRDPTLYPNDPVYGVDIGNDYILITDPITHVSSRVAVPTRGGFDTPWCDQPGFATLGCPAEGGVTAFPDAYQNPANPHNPMMDDTGKVWITTQIRAEVPNPTLLPDFCFEQDPEIAGGHRQMGYYDTNTGEFALIDTCFGTHHLQFDNDDILWISGDSRNVGWIDTKMIDEDNCGVESCPSEEQAQGWSRVVVDSDGDGEADTPLVGFHYGIIPNLVDGTVWTGVLGAFPGRIERYDPATDTHEAYEPPLPGHGPRGIDADTEGNIWTCLAGSSHVAKFDRSQCAQTWGTGNQCPEGWTLYEVPGPNFKGTNIKSDYHYYVWVDQFNTLGLGENIVVCNGTGSDSLIAFDPETQQFTRIVMPYPLGFFQRGLDGRIDNPNTGWKGRGWWVDYGIDPIIHTETQQGQICKIQLRPDPLAE